MVAATRSMTRNGNRTVRPISNAVRSSLRMNAGMPTRSGTSSAVAGRGAFETSKNSYRSLSLVCASRKFRRGRSLGVIACDSSI